MSWIINENTRVSSTQYFNASYSTTLVAANGAVTDSATQNVAGYTSGTISFTITPAPTGGGWAGSSTLEMIILGGIDSNSFIVNTLVIPVNDPDTTFYVDWNIPLETVALRVNNDTTTSTGVEIIVSAISMQTESEGGGIGYVSSTHPSTIAPDNPPTSIQFNDGGVFGGADGALYDKTANTQIQLAAGTASLPMLAFSDGTHPTGNYDTGIYRNVADMVAFSTAGIQKVTCSNSDTTPFIKGINVGLQANIAGIRRISATAANSWEDGYLGNSEFLYFSPLDFVGDASTRNVWGSNTQTGPIVAFTNTLAALLAVKVMPKGFRVRASTAGDICQLYSRDAAGFSATVNVTIVEQLIVGQAGAFTTTLLGDPPIVPAWVGGQTRNLEPIHTGSVSDGTLQICIMIHNPNNNITQSTGLVGGRVPIERV